MSATTARDLAALAAGTLFGLGLALAGMVDPHKVLAFLDLAGDWDPSLLFVLGAAVLTAGLGLRLLRHRPRPLFDADFHPPTARSIDGALLLGSALFGLGWGLAGYCPGPALASLGLANAEAAWFVPALLAGAALQRWRARGAAAAAA